MKNPNFSEEELTKLGTIVEYWREIDLIEDKKDKMRRINNEAQTLFHAIPAINVLRSISYWYNNRNQDGNS